MPPPLEAHGSAHGAGGSEARPRSDSLSAARTVAAVCAGLFGAVLIWIVTPINDLVFNSPYISDSYLPVAGLFYMLLLLLGLNPLLRRLAPSRALNSRQMALIFGMVLVASVVPGQGLMRILPHAVAKVPRAVRENAALAEAYRAARLPAALFPDALGFGTPTPAADGFLLELPRGERIPWRNWMPPLAGWGLLMLFCWFMALGLASIAYPQGKRAERLPFPLLTVGEAMIEDPGEGHAFGGLFRERSFWIAAGVVFALHLLAGAKAYNPAAVPAIPLSFSLQALFTEEPFNHIPWWIFSNRIYFTFVGAAFFMPGRTAFSIWFFVLAYAVYRVAAQAYVPPFHEGTVVDHRLGAMAAVTLTVLWLGRARWAAVARSIFVRRPSEEQRRDRTAGLMFAAGCAGMLGWMRWLGVEWPWAIVFVVFAFMASLLIGRIVAETGMPFVRIDTGAGMAILKALPVTWYSAPALWFSQIVTALFTMASRVSAVTMALHAQGLDRDASPRQQARLTWLLLALLLAGLVLSGASTLVACYTHTTSLDGLNAPLSRGGTEMLDAIGSDMVRRHATLQRGRADALARPAYNQPAHMGFGAALAALLSWACLTMPRWPIHPIGLLIVDSVYAQLAWFSILIGWLLKSLILHYGGARFYRRAKPFFMGLIVGEVFAAVLWFLVPAFIIAAGGVSYRRVSVVPQ